jgi:phage host-nuclease inhibitor protein Gam
MSPRIKKLVAAVPRTKEEMEAMVQATIEMQTEREKLVAQRDEARTKADSPFAPRISELDTGMAHNIELLEAWAESHRVDFGKDKSLLVRGHRMGWKLGNWKTELLKKWKWADVLFQLKSMGKRGAEFIRTKEEPNKEQMLASRDKPELLAEFGVTVVQEETFYLAPDREGQDPALMTA